MKRLALSLVELLIFLACNAQMKHPAVVEFDNEKDGLMYADSTMKTLRHMVDSLNIRFKTCDSRTYYSMPQGKVWSVRFTSSTSDLSNIRQDIINGAGFETIIARYKQMASRLDTSQMVIKVHSPAGNQGSQPYYYLVGSPPQGYGPKSQVTCQKYRAAGG